MLDTHQLKLSHRQEPVRSGSCLLAEQLFFEEAPDGVAEHLSLVSRGVQFVRWGPSGRQGLGWIVWAEVVLAAESSGQDPPGLLGLWEVCQLAWVRGQGLADCGCKRPGPGSNDDSWLGG